MERIKASRGPKLRCKGWRQEAILRMLENNLENAEKPDQLIVYGGTGKAARNWEAFHRIVDSFQSRRDDETLIVQSGTPVAVFKTHRDAPRVLIANAHLVPKWSNWETFYELEALGLTMYGQMTAGGWSYIGSQGIVQGTYETFAACARRHFGGSLKGRLVLTGGMGGMGGAQPLAIKMNEGVCLDVDVDEARIKRRVANRCGGRGNRSRSTCGRCWRSSGAGAWCSTTGTTSGGRRRRRASRTRSRSKGSCPCSSVRSSRRAEVRSDGSPSRATRTTSSRRTASSCGSFRRTR